MNLFKNIKTPALANWLTSKFIGEIYQEEFFSDLEEIFAGRLQRRGVFYARLMKPVIHIMLRHFLKSTWNLP